MKKLVYLSALLLVFLPGRAFSIGHNSPKYLGLRNQFIPKDTNTKKDSVKNDSTEEVKTRKFAIGLEGATDQTHYGLRNKNVKLPYLEPSFTYTAKSGFYIEANDQYILIKKGGGFDVFGLNPGWDIDLTDNTTLNFNYQLYRFRSGSPQLIRTSLNNVLETYLEQDIGNLTGKLSIDYDIYKATKGQPKTPNDFIFTPDVSYDLEVDFGKKSSLTFTPEVNIDFGTRNFYTQYQNAQVNDSISKKLKPKYQSYSSSSNSSFGSLDYNLMLTIEYKVGSFKIEPAVTYCTPLYKPDNQPNPATTFGSVTLIYTIKGKK